MRSLPIGFYLSFAGAVLCGGLALWLAARLLRRAFAGRRLAALAADERGTAVVEFPFVFITLIQVTIWAWQLAFIATAYQVVDYAAFAAARCAVVTIPLDWTKESAGEIRRVELDGLSGSGVDTEDIKQQLTTHVKENKRRDVRWAAAFVVYAISGRKSVDSAPVTGGATLGTPFGDVDFSGGGLSWPDQVAATLDDSSILTRFKYAADYTSATVEPPSGQGSDLMLAFGAGDTVTVTVTHELNLPVPFANVLFRTGVHPEGTSYLTISGRATMLVEDSHAEATPPSPPPQGDPKGS
jgi:Flp pilus assembly protein TadG